MYVKCRFSPYEFVSTSQIILGDLPSNTQGLSIPITLHYQSIDVNWRWCNSTAASLALRHGRPAPVSEKLPQRRATNVLQHPKGLGVLPGRGGQGPWNAQWVMDSPCISLSDMVMIGIIQPWVIVN